MRRKEKSLPGNHQSPSQKLLRLPIISSPTPYRPTLPYPNHCSFLYIYYLKSCYHLCYIHASNNRICVGTEVLRHFLVFSC